jgi:hypothetical protein
MKISLPERTRFKIQECQGRFRVLKQLRRVVWKTQRVRLHFFTDTRIEKLVSDPRIVDAEYVEWFYRVKRENGEWEIVDKSNTKAIQTYYPFETRTEFINGAYDGTFDSYEDAVATIAYYYGRSAEIQPHAWRDV